MKNKSVSISIIVVVAIIVVGYLFANTKQKKEITVSKIDDQGVYVGPKIPKSKENSINPVLRDINYAWDNIDAGNRFYNAGQYEQAVEAYKKSYAIKTTPAGAFSGLRLIESYEKLGRFDEALAIIEDLEKNNFKGEKGLQKAAQLRAQLLAAKNQLVSNKE